MTSAFYITTPIYYVNAKPHLGHAYTTIIADVIRRFHDMKGMETFFLTGTDEHGDKIEQAAQKENISPKEYADKISGLFRALWPELNASHDDFIRTTDPRHIAVVKEILQKIYDKGDIYYSEYEGLYCFGCERFYTERELVDGKCPDHQVAPETIRESNYFFRMSAYQQWLIDHIKANPDFIRPERYRNEVLSFLKEPLEDLCISRPKSRLNWGISLPFDDNYVTYVWFDALINYISAMGYPDGERYKKFWPHVQHIVAKDILKPHGIYWPTMLKAADLPIYNHLNVHGYWNVDESKMSKSLGNVIDPFKLKSIYGLDAFRFFLLRDMVFGLDSDFNEEAIVQRINSDLANDLGNLFSRTIAMVHKYFAGKAPAPKPSEESSHQLNLAGSAEEAIDGFEENMPVFGFHKALMSVWTFIGQMNKYIDAQAPWVLAKDESARDRLASVMANLLEGLRVVSGLIYPIMPETAATMQRHLGLDPSGPFYLLEELRKWNCIPSGTVLPKPITLFPRIDTKPVQQKKKKEKPGKKPGKATIDFEDFKKIELRAGIVLDAEAVENSSNLLKLTVDIGERRTIVSGIARQYRPEDLKGMQVVIVANLKPADIMGITSEGMLVAAGKKKVEGIAIIDRPVKPGTLLK